MEIQSFCWGWFLWQGGRSVQYEMLAPPQNDSHLVCLEGTIPSCYFSPNLQKKEKWYKFNILEEYCWSSRMPLFSQRTIRKDKEGNWRDIRNRTYKTWKAMGDKKLFPVSAGDEGNWRIQLDITISSLWGFNNTGNFCQKTISSATVYIEKRQPKGQIGGGFMVTKVKNRGDFWKRNKLKKKKGTKAWSKQTCTKLYWGMKTIGNLIYLSLLQ